MSIANPTNPNPYTLLADLLAEIKPRQQALRQRFDQLYRGLWWTLCREGMIWTLGSLVIAGLLLWLLDWLCRFDLASRQLMLGLALLGVGYILWQKWVRPICWSAPELDLAMLVDRYHPGVGQWSANVLGLAETANQGTSVSLPMVRATILADDAALSQVDFRSILDYQRHRQRLGLGFATLLLPVSLAILLPQSSSLFIKRWFAGSEQRWPQQTYLSLLGLGEEPVLRAPRGEPLLLQIEAQPTFEPVAGGWKLRGRGEVMVLPTATPPTPVPPAAVYLSLTMPDGSTDQLTLEKISASQFHYQIPLLRQPLRLRLSGGDDWLPPIQIEPIDRPSLASWQLTALDPRSGTASTFDATSGQLLFLKNTALTLDLHFNEPVQQVKVDAATGALPALTVLSDTHCRATWTFTEAQTLEIEAVARASGLAAKPILLAIELLQDRPPRVLVRSSGVGRRITPQATIPLTIQINDDFGLTKVDLALEKTVFTSEAPKTDSVQQALFPALPPTQTVAPANTNSVTPAHPTAPREFRQEQRLQMQPFAVPAGSLIKLSVQATDDCADGVQLGTSRLLSFQVVLPDELFYEILMRQRAARAQFQKAYQVAQEQLETLELDPDFDKELAGILRRHQVCTREVGQVTSKLDATLQELILNELGTKETRELLEQDIILPMQSLQRTADGNEGLFVTLRQQYQQMSASPVTFQEGLPTARDQQETLTEAMKRLLAQMEQWESFVDVINQVRAIKQLQQDLLDATKQNQNQLLNLEPAPTVPTAPE